MKRMLFFAVLLTLLTPYEGFSAEQENISNRVQIQPIKKDEEEYKQLLKEAEKAESAKDLTKLLDKCGNYSKNISFDEGRKCFDKVYEIAKKNFVGKSDEETILDSIIDKLIKSGDFYEAEKRLDLYNAKENSVSKDNSLSKIIKGEARSAGYYGSKELMNRAIDNLNKISNKYYKENTISLIVGHIYETHGKEEAFKNLNLLNNEVNRLYGLSEIFNAMVNKGNIDEALETLKEQDASYKYEQYVYGRIAEKYINSMKLDEAEKYIQKISDKENIKYLSGKLNNMKKYKQSNPYNQ